MWYSPSSSFSKYPQKEVSLFLRFECTGDDDVTSRIQIKPSKHLTRISVTPRCGCTAIVIHKLFVKFCCFAVGSLCMHKLLSISPKNNKVTLYTA